MPLTNAPKILRGAFIEYGLSIPPLFVVFQFNPEELSRSRSLSFAPENDPIDCPLPWEREGEGSSRTSRRPGTLRAFHQRFSDLDELQQRQQVVVQEESLSFDIRLDAKEKAADGDPLSVAFGVLPQLATLELMMHPKEEGMLGAALGALLGSPGGFSFTKRPNPPMVLFLFGHKRVLPVNIDSMSIRETEFSPLLDPVRATVSVSLTVIEGKDPFYTYSKVVKEISSVLNLANIADVANVVVPG